MATLTLRSAKGSPLTNNEVDANFTNLNTDKYESGDNVSLGTIAGTTVSVTSVTTTAGLTVGGSSTLSTSATVTAAGSDQSGATALTKSYNIVTTATADQGVVLPDCVVGLEAFLLNDTAVNVKIYPASGESIDGGSANAAVDLAPGHSLKLVGVSATKWNRLSPVIIYNSSGTRVN
tara:strand:+ start:3154 stop:3684 length:531 start_codon:yes stop_codon:yes gene_type:complete